MEIPAVIVCRQKERRSAAARRSGKFGANRSALCYEGNVIGCGVRSHVTRFWPGRRALLCTSLARGLALIVKSAYKFARLSTSPTIAIKLIHSSRFHYHTSISSTNLNYHQLHSQWVTRRVRYHAYQEALDVIATTSSRHDLSTLIDLRLTNHVLDKSVR